MTATEVLSSTASPGRARYDLQIPDIDYYRSNVDCASACPVQTDARGYVTAIERGDYEEAWWIARQPNPFASICGWICAAPCEMACRRSRIDDAIAIRPLKRFVNEIHGVLQNPFELRGDLTAPQNSRTAGSVSAILDYVDAFDGIRKTGARVAIIGAGPAGLTAAHDLSLMRHRVTIHEAASTPGGAMYAAVPPSRVDRDLVARECHAILDMPGVDIHYNSRLGEDVELAQLRDDFDAVVIATGLWSPQRPAVPGGDLEGVADAATFIGESLLGEGREVGDHVVVIGGDDRAFDAARRAVQSQIAAGKPIDVHVFADGNAADPVSGYQARREAELEGVAVHAGWELAECSGNGAVETVTCTPTMRDPEGMVALPVERNRDRGTWEVRVPAETVVVSMDRAADLSFLKGLDGLAAGSLIETDAATNRTGVEMVYAAGETVSGPATIIDAVQTGHVVARSVEEDFQGRRIAVKRTGKMTVIPPNDYLVDGYLDTPRQEPMTLEPFERRGDAPTELAFSEDEARTEASRCLKCNVNTVFNGDLCTVCNLCVDVCPYDCLQLVSLDDVKGAGLDSAVKERYGLGLDFFRLSPPESLEVGIAMMKDDDVCTRCGLCAERCPVDVITMEWFSFSEALELVEIGAV